MSLKYKYWIYLFLLHGLLTYAAYLVFENKLYFILSEIGIILLLVLGYYFFRQFARPLELIESGTNALESNDFTVKYVETGSPDLDSLVKVYNKMIDRLRVERTKMEEQSYFLEKIINASPVGILMLDYDGRISDINPVAKKILGLKNKWRKLDFNKLNHPLVKKLGSINENPNQLITLTDGLKYKCQVEDVIHKGFPRKFLMIQDLTLEITASEKIAYGKIIRMMAHEVNNSVGAINSILDTVKTYGFDIPGGDKDLADSLGVAIERNKGLVEFMKNFAEVIRLPAPLKARTNLIPLLRNAGHLFHAVAAEKNIKIEYDLSDDPVYVSCDPVQIEQVLTNVIKNAMESIDYDGHILISNTENPAGFIIRDNGAGISESVAEDIFTPFFSTKPTGQGVGLMLCREILQNHSASYRLYSEGEYTRFVVAF